MADRTSSARPALHVGRVVHDYARSNIVAVSLPAIARNLHAAFADIEWVVSAYILTFAAFLMPAGALADRFGHRKQLILGLTLFTVASGACGVATTALVLNLSRALQGVGAAIQLSAALAVISHTFRGPDRAKAFGFWGTVIGVAVAVGPIVGGLITSGLGWRWAFLVNLPVGIALIVLAIGSVNESRDPDARRLDLPGMALFGVGLFSLVWAMIGSNADGWSSRPTGAKLVAALFLFVCYVIVERAQQRPMVDFGLFRKRTFLGSSFAMLGFASAAQVMMTYLPLYLQNVYALSPAVAGLGMLPFALPLFFFPRIAVYLATKISGRSLLSLGLAVVSAGNILTAAAIITAVPPMMIWVGMFLTGCGAGMLNGETTKVSMSVIPPERSGMASGIGGTLRFVGLVMGITGLGAVLSDQTRHYFDLATTTAGVAGLSDSRDFMVSRIVAGDIGSVVARVQQSLQAPLAEIARHSFAFGFATVLFVAAGSAALTGLLTFVLVSPSETAPSHPQTPAQVALPEALD